ncbi:TetR/AcrR family transcriptional regulator [Amaricoccus solimangrovi]|uniref:TetR/AcrR family transcriptional regulator n=1 Tax=Amaricoccus solimangrovi TaxID=2589815 RepID=A0A501WIV4_9RHOB|nr:TetR/AcrR family transcriptional regulator [Amaricoccus solimangrovi]TPE48300.1 TetR/AcrR family transcriptional regulator [Amaricoccus solimangrovi]
MADRDPEQRRSYHHGNLRQALVEAAIALIEEKGPLGFTLAEAARAAGVSPAAPYRHFRNREDLVAEVARQGFVIFGEQLERAFDGGRPSPLSAFSATGGAYLGFARSHPGFYMAMFEAGAGLTGTSELAHAAQRALDVMIRAAELLSAQLPPERRPPPTMVANHIWAFSHGVVELFARGAPGARAPYTPEEMLESGTGIYLRGLGVLPL